MTAGPYSIGSDLWPGLSKLAEEAGETLQVIGKIMGTGGVREHWDGSDLRDRLAEELADLSAAVEFVAKTNGIDIRVRGAQKFATFQKWHREAATPPAQAFTADAERAAKQATLFVIEKERERVRAVLASPTTSASIRTCHDALSADDVRAILDCVAARLGIDLAQPAGKGEG